ncbi:DUF930 domain-containing protein [Rhizobiaceae bacterium n13]|uniref:DUF930 domain-containing protein n=1 Tax=Ferirhizobium litorale TaxID=2927786 RepID=A0AAE3QDP0_9HYPH|nr:DUF930 domain-containing protein [Fererhizobium litorale]MDI7861309.1 DUF930 domain-containing protein [Fererhizobium litorale]MDI7921456.1 DUF930 domain-containing protein [Fererhizobium litorale]
MIKAAALLLLSASPVLALDKSIVSQLQKLDPETRLEQRCDTEALDRIAKGGKGFKPDKVIAYTFSDPVHGNNSIEAPGAVFRSKGEWYRLSYSCKTGPKHIKVQDFDYKVGKQVPRDKWEEYYLYD